MLWTVALTLFVCILPTQDAKPFDWHSLNLPEEHIPYFFYNNPSIKAACEEDEACPYKEHTRTLGCWGYEKSCPEYQRMSMPSCPGDSRGWTQSKPAQVDLFWKEGDFGYIMERKEDMISMCEPQEKDASSLKCSRHTQYCQAKNIYFDFRKSKMSEGTDRYRENMLKQGEIGGHCKFHPSRLRNEGDHKSPLQSWFAELEDYSSLNFKPIDNTNCDIIIEKPTYFIKLDAGINMYHHFCDFVNLYASQHLNNSFSTDAYIVMWDTSGYGYGDFFKETWKVHTDYPIIPLKDYDGKKVCFKEAVFSLLARMRLGMYYNMPLVPGCSDSSFFRAYSQHTLHRLNIPQYGPLDTKIRVTLLSRNTKFRNILNEKEIINALKTNGEYEVNVVEYNMKMPFLDQLEKTHNSDIFMGMHGAGLTHLLFLPDWAVAFEIYNCDDQHCYLDLARLRGVKYMTWENMDKLKQEDEGHHPQLGAHKKFTNYGFDVSEFMRMVAKAAEHVRTHSSFIEARQKKYPYLIQNQKKVEL